MATHFIITGASRGIGKALAEAAIGIKNSYLYLTARKQKQIEDNPSLQAKNVFSFFADHGDQRVQEGKLKIENYYEPLFQNLDKNLQRDRSHELYLVNNAGILEPLSFSGKQSSLEISRHIAVNLIAPMQLSNLILARYLDHNEVAEIRILNISSGAASSIYAGWSCYGASKAGLNQFTRNVALELTSSGKNASIAALAPGVIESNMQQLIRSSKEEDFPQKEKFIDLYQENKLRPAKQTAEIIINWLGGENFENGAVLRIEDIEKDIEKS